MKGLIMQSLKAQYLDFGQRSRLITNDVEDSRQICRAVLQNDVLCRLVKSRRRLGVG